ncbi:hypothetical protein [Polynucleobacter asymbioticus]|uniref:Glycosyltransferase RgtA/B/C/D-like domain-containing protein n=1 Tax=Polynucleobacter asymbioticus (strain DSM 18221 / CIP 109841 / QLW-P1DMWA-1) TaxID=312153 RepID=A4SVM9_POLAQ|nr:hypothetical protein [Polynucleobacter asymbioticus]ABP33543.1 hypothetical protein Pnuc_0322 [Polynucleobacter asymbioticus QLW-P1DMWA-1]
MILDNKTPSYVLIILISLAFFLVLLPLGRPYPYADDWMYVYQLSDLNQALMKSLFLPHNEHYIPLQNLIHLALLKISGLDFRILIGFNVLCSALVSFLWINILDDSSDNKEGYLPFCIVPLISMGWGFNTVYWGFNFQFISGILFMSCSLYYWVKSIRNNDLYCHQIFIFLLLCALCGGNGLIESLFIGAGILIAIIIFKRKFLKSKSNLIIIILWFSTILLLTGATWLNSINNQGHHGALLEVLKFYNGLTGSWLGIFGSRLTKFESLFMIFLSLAPIFYCGYGLANQFSKNQINKISLYSYSILLVSTQTIILCFVISISRASMQPWWAGLELHYGYLFITIPFAGIYMLLKLKNKYLKNSISFASFMIFLLIFVSNAAWRIAAARAENHQFIMAVGAIMSSEPSNTVAENFIKEFYWGSGGAEINSVSLGLDQLRKHGIWLKN